MNKIINNATKRQEKSIKENNKGFGIKRDEKIRIRIDENYIPTYKKINKSIIDINSKNIKEEVKKSTKKKK